MLLELRIANFAIIDHLEIMLKPGLITFTGETGAGKSIIIDAVETLLGGRGEATLIRSGSDRCYIEGTFVIPNNIKKDVHRILEREEMLDYPDQVTLSREIRLGGRNVVRVNGRVANVGLLRELGNQLVDVHGQSEHLSLLRVREHLNLLDRYAGNDEILANYQRSYEKLSSVRHEIKELRQLESEAIRQIDLLQYQIHEIEVAHLQPGEEEELLAERIRLSNAEGLANFTQQALQALEESTSESPSTIDLFGQVIEAITGIAKLDPVKSANLEHAQELFEKLNELSIDLRLYLDNIEFNPKRLDQIEERLDLIHNLKRKYGDAIPKILSYRENALQRLENISHASDRLQELEKLEKELLLEISEKGQALSARRNSAAQVLKKELENELEDLLMPEAHIEIEIKQQPDQQGVLLQDGRRVAFHECGLENVQFLIAPNPGEGFKPLVKIASGGETSRLMLALKNVLANADYLPTLIFDEIDQGIGGRAGLVVGSKLWHLARYHQVLCITHLPQLAAFGDQHFQVRKEVKSGRTITHLDELSGELRVAELAQMLGETSQGTLQSARDLLQITEEMLENKRL